MKLTALHREFKRFALAERGLKPQTVRDILVIVRRLCAFLGTDELSQTTTAAIQEFLHEGRVELGWGARTFRLYRQYLKTFFAWSVGAGYAKVNPVSPIQVPRLPQQLPRCLSRDEARKVLYAARHVPWSSEVQQLRSEAIVGTFLMAGLRRAELLNLRVVDLDLDSGLLCVRGGKGRKDRTVPLHPRLSPLLRHYLRVKTKEVGVSTVWLFTSLKSGRRLTNKNLYALLKRVAGYAGVKFTPHMLRHTFGRELVEADFNIYKLKEVMGHASVVTTQAYVALSPQNIKASFEKTKIY